MVVFTVHLLHGNIGGVLTLTHLRRDLTRHTQVSVTLLVYMCGVQWAQVYGE